MEWRSLFIGLLIGALIAVPLGMAHSGGFEVAERTGPCWGFGPMDGYMHGMMDDEMYAEMEEHRADGSFLEMHEEREEHMGSRWVQMHEYCEGIMGIEEEE